MKRIFSLLVLVAPIAFAAPTPHWIWPDKAQLDGDVAYFRKALELPAGTVKTATVEATADNGFTLFVNGTKVLAGGNWGVRYSANVAKLLKPGQMNVLAAEGRNAGSPAGFVARLTVDIGGKKTVLVSDPTWLTSR